MGKLLALILGTVAGTTPFLLLALQCDYGSLGHEMCITLMPVAIGLGLFSSAFVSIYSMDKISKKEIRHV